MALLRNIEQKYKWWRFNNGIYIEPTDEQKRIASIDRKNAARDFVSLFGTLNALLPSAIDKTVDQVRCARKFGM